MGVRKTERRRVKVKEKERRMGIERVLVREKGKEQPRGR